MTKCAVLFCKNYSNRTTNVSFHPFPNDLTRKREWVKAVRREKSWVPTKHHRICSLHFEANCFNAKAVKQRKLNKDAVPTLHLPEFFETNASPATLCTTEVKTERLEEPASSADSLSEDTEDQPLRRGRLTTIAVDPLSPKHCSSESDEESNASIRGRFKESKVTQLERKLKEKEETCNKHLHKMEWLLKANRRLCQQNNNLKRILMTMKNKINILEGKTGKKSDDEDSS